MIILIFFYLGLMGFLLQFLQYNLCDAPIALRIYITSLFLIILTRLFFYDFDVLLIDLGVILYVLFTLWVSTKNADTENFNVFHR